jgi:hypothetical protein
VAAGCGGPVRQAAKGPAELLPVERLELDLEQHDPEAPLPLRYNPVTCGCPPWEAEIGGAWVRASLEPVSDAAIEAVSDLAQRAEADAEAGAVTRYAIQAEADDVVYFCPGTRTLMVRVVPEAPLPERPWRYSESSHPDTSSQ